MGLRSKTDLPSAARFTPTVFSKQLSPPKLSASGNPERRDAIAPDAYRLRFRFADGSEIETYDPYAFPPVLTDYDLYLLGEGTHYRNYEKLGAHIQEIAGIRGRAFCGLGAERASA